MSKTWKKDTDDLFDFDTEEIETKKMTLSKFNPKFFLVYSEEKLKLIDSPKELLEKYKEYQKKKKTSEIIINNDNNTSNNNINEVINLNNIININNINNINNNQINNNILNNNNNSNEINSINNNPFLVVSEFSYIPPYSFKIVCPILSPYLRKNIKESSLCRSWRLCKKDEENLISIGDVIKLGRARLKIDTICIGEIFESCQINFINNRKKKNMGKINKKNIEKNFINQKTNANKEKDMIENSKVSKISEMREEGLTYNPNIINDFNNNSGFSSHNPESSKRSTPSCRICFLTNSSEENPLISPCKCNGSMKNIHYICLKKCIESKIIKKTEQNFKSYSWKSFSCEICKAEYPKYIKIKETLFSLVDLEINYSSYVTCDYTLYYDLKKKTFRKGIIIFKINDENDDDDIITVGRSQNNKIKLKDISVSRNHCNFLKKKNKLYIVDKGSKFGTLIYLNSPLGLTPESTEGTLISGKHLFSVSLQKKQNFLAKIFPFCCWECNNQINPKGDVDVLEDKNSFVSEEDDDNNSNNNNFSGNDNYNFIIDELYQDYVLDLGNDIYIHSEIESEKPIS